MSGAETVTLNVGGAYFVTRRETLAGSQSFFSGLVASGAGQTANEFFVDRDPTYFRYVLNWMRGVRHLPDEDNALRELAWEADYFCMQDMHQAIVHSRERYSMGRALHEVAAVLKRK